MHRFPFSVDAQDGGARATTLKLARGEVATPVFMPVGTQGAIRALSPDHVLATGSQIVLANTYHLSQRPGERIVEKHGGLHKMMGIPLPILTDSGGFQVFSLKKSKVDEEGVTFAYEVDGNQTFLSPERSMEIQQALGSDIAMVFDECLAYGVDKARCAQSIERTARWEARSKAAHRREDQSLFGIVQGGFWPDLRERSTALTKEIGFDGYAIGGLSVGEGHAEMLAVLDATTHHLPADRPRYLMGVGRPIDLVEGVARGIDMFDCVIPTRHARSGMLYTRVGRIRVSDKRYRSDMYPPDTSCGCFTCRTFTRAYLHHLFKVGEILAASLATLHNLFFFSTYMREMRAAIVDGRFAEFRAEARRVWASEDHRENDAQDSADEHEAQREDDHRDRREHERPRKRRG